MLASNIVQINRYKSKLNKSSGSSGSFTISRPYLIVRTEKGKSEDIYFDEYSESLKKNLDQTIVNGLKTIIVEYRFPEKSATYSDQYHPVRRKVTSYGSYLIYFDLEKKECVGYDVLRAPKLPSTLPLGTSAWVNFIGNIIKSRLQE